MSVLFSAGVLTLLADFLFWDHIPGISLAIYCCMVAGFTIAIRWRKGISRLTWIAGGLMLAASCATAVEISFTNVAVLLALLAVITGECWYAGVPAGRARWTESLVAWASAPGRWPWLLRKMEKIGSDCFCLRCPFIGKTATQRANSHACSLPCAGIQHGLRLWQCGVWGHAFARRE